MEMSGEQIIPATQVQTWDALNNPEILKECVPGCESITKTAENEYLVLMTARIGPVSAKFKGKLALSDLNPPNSYAIAFEGQGGVAGFGKGGATVQLAPETAGTGTGGNTRLTYQVKANVGGKLAQIGSRLVDAAAKKLAVEFFDAFNAKVASLYPGHGSGSAGHDDQGPGGSHDDGHPQPVADSPDKPRIDDGTLRFVAAGSLMVFVVSLLALF